MTTTDGAPWLDAEETRTWLALLSLTLLGLKPIETDLRTDSELTLFEYLVLSQLSMSPDRTARMSQLAFLANGSPSRLSNVVSRFEKRGWVTRGPDPEDGRGALARLTDEGFAVVEAAAPDHVRSVRRHVIDRLSPAQRESLQGIGHSLGIPYPD